jgi:lipoprotein-releasing system ATP-binding protein
MRGGTCFGMSKRRRRARKIFWTCRSTSLRRKTALYPFPYAGDSALQFFVKADLCLSCRDLERYLGEDESRVHALRGVSLDIAPGSVHAVTGPSGCGKSTLLYLLGLLDRADGGSIMLECEPVADLPDDELSRKRNQLIGFIFQFHFLLEDFTAQENVMIPMRRLGHLDEPAMKERARELLGAVGLQEKLHRLSRHLSGGEQQRVAIARALANDPRVILADEPTGNLDTENSRRAFELLRGIVQEKQKALLLVTHNPTIAEACDSVHEMRDGKIIATHLQRA